MLKDLRPLVQSSRIVGVALVAAATVLAACSDSTSAPSQAQSDPAAAVAYAKSLAFALPQTYVAQGLLRTTPLTQSVSVTKTIMNTGGTIVIPGTGMQLSIPRGAFSESALTFTVTARAGNTVAYDFEPHGHTFLQPLTFSQNVAGTNLRGAYLPLGFVPEISGAYFTSGSLVDPKTGVSVVSEFRPAALQVTTTGNMISFPIWHFSGYLVSVGRSEEF